MSGVRTLLIGVDGATFDVLDPLMDAGAMPNLAGLIRDGASATLRTVVPALTPPAWTSLTTGRSPGAHGIFDFFRREDTEGPQIRMLTGGDVATPPVWNLADRAGLSSTVLNFPMTFPAPRVRGHVVPGWMPWKQLRVGCRPADLFDRLRALPGFNARELAMDMSLEEKAIEGCRLEERAEWVELHTRRERQWQRILRYLMTEEPSALTAVMFDGVDKLQHLCWRFISPELATGLDSPVERRIRAACLDYFRALDEIVGDAVALAGDRADVVVASDHGFGSQVRTFFVNAWLERRGDLAWAERSEPRAGQDATLGVGQLARHVYLLDWERTRAFAPTPSGNGVHIVRRSEATPGGVPADEYEAYREALTADLLALRGPGGERVVAEVWPRERIFAGPFVELAPDLTLVLDDGGLISILGHESPVAGRDEPFGTHHPDGIFVASGPGIRAVSERGWLSILDVAPLLMRSLGLEIPDDMEGRLPVELLRHGNGAARPLRVPSASRAPAATGGDATPDLDPAAEAEIVRRLRNLGYLD